MDTRYNKDAIVYFCISSVCYFVLLLMLTKLDDKLYMFTYCYNKFFDGNVKVNLVYNIVFVFGMVGLLINCICTTICLYTINQTYSKRFLMSVIDAGLCISMVYLLMTKFCEEIIDEKFVRSEVVSITGDLKSNVYMYYNLTDTSEKCPVNTIMHLPQYNLILNKCEMDSEIFNIMNKYNIENLPNYINNYMWLLIFYIPAVCSLYIFIIISLVLLYKRLTSSLSCKMTISSEDIVIDE